jgi:membrane-associated phospholipid phosphatase
MSRLYTLPGLGLAGQRLLHWLAAVAFLSLLTLVFLGLAEDVWSREGFVWDAPLMLAIHSASHPWLDGLMRLATQAGEAGAILTAGVLVVRFARQRNYLDAASILMSLSGAFALNTIVKLILARPRPRLFVPLAAESGFSFPSGHVAASVAVYGSLAVMLWRRGHRIWAIGCALAVPIVALSRIYLGVHYPSDTIAAAALASAWLMLVFLVRDHLAGRAKLPADQALPNRQAV